MTHAHPPPFTKTKYQIRSVVGAQLSCTRTVADRFHLVKKTAILHHLEDLHTLTLGSLYHERAI